MILRFTGLLVLCFGCSVSPPIEESLFDEELQRIEDLLWNGEEEAALEILEPMRWAQSGSVALERIRQDLRISLGQREAVVEELLQWRASNSAAPDLRYLQARLLEDPVGRFQTLRTLTRQYPQHSWSRLGLVATAQLMNRWQEAQKFLQGADVGPDAGGFYRLVAARQLAHNHQYHAALQILQQDAFVLHNERALMEYANLAVDGGDNNEARRARSALNLHRVNRQDASAGQRIDVAFQRLIGEWHHCENLPLHEILTLLDQWCVQAGAPAGWQNVPLYSLAGVAAMVRPETDLGGVSAAWAKAGRYLLAGSAYGRGKELHMLRDVIVMRFLWPKHDSPIEVVAAGSVLTPQATTAQGGTVFRGFYLRLDSLERGAEQLRQRLEQLRNTKTAQQDFLHTPAQELCAQLDPYETMELPTRLRLQILADTGSSVRDLELLHLALHEAGHLGEVLTWLDVGLPLVSVSAQFLNSQLELGNPLLWLEYHAQLRALASGWQPDWALAEIIDRAQQPRDPYYPAYRSLFRDLISEAAQAHLPHVARWDLLQPGQIVTLARRVLAKKKLQPSPDLGNDRLVQMLVDFNLLEHTPGDRVLPMQFD